MLYNTQLCVSPGSEPSMFSPLLNSVSANRTLLMTVMTDVTTGQRARKMLTAHKEVVIAGDLFVTKIWEARKKVFLLPLFVENRNAIDNEIHVRLAVKIRM